MIFAAYLATIFLILCGLVVWKVEKKRTLTKRIQAVLIAEQKMDPIVTANELKGLSFSKRVMNPFLNSIKQIFKRNLSRDKKEKIEMKLLQAGSPLGMTAIEYRMTQLVVCIIVPIIFALYGSLLGFPFGGIVLCCLIGIAFAVYLPSYYMKKKAANRGGRAIMELPDFLDLLTVSMEAGLGFDSALSKVVTKKDGVLSREFQRCLEEMRLGKTRREALSSVRDRLLAEDVKTFIASIIQAEQLGVGMVQILNVQSVEIRERRKQRAEERAMKAPIKMLFPLVIFIFPCIFIILLGPAVIGFLETF